VVREKNFELVKDGMTENDFERLELFFFLFLRILGRGGIGI